jgi:hypothetical protein
MKEKEKNGRDKGKQPEKKLGLHAIRKPFKRTLPWVIPVGNIPMHSVLT